MLLSCVFFVFSSCLFTMVKSSTVVVDSPFGKIQGVKKTDENTGLSYLSFKGIPYARPPLGDLRFAKPQPHPKIDGIFDASKDNKVLCPHPNAMTLNETGFTEDCLILNIQTKEINPSKDLKKVIAFIHGGGYVIGGSYYYESKSLILSQDVIFVSFNYRIGALGFLSTENEASPGNFGLWDQTLAIKWVKDNIRAFGGDPDDITIAGESAGGASVGYQILSPHAKGLFTKAYLQSSTGTSVFCRGINSQSIALIVAKIAGCWEKDDVDTKISLQESKVVVDCLRKAPLSAITEFSDFRNSRTHLVPLVDYDFIPDFPAKLLQDDNYLDFIGFFDRSYLIGFNNNELGIIENYLKMTKYAIFANDQMTEEEKQSAYEAVQVGAKNLHLRSRLGEVAASDDGIISKINDFYQRRFTDDTRILMEITNDLNMLIPSLDYLVAASRRESCNSYFLYFNHYPHFMKGIYRGSFHGVDLAYWFDVKTSDMERLLNAGMDGEFAEEDEQLKTMFLSIIGDFIRTGNPGLTLKNIMPSGWPRYDTTNAYYLNFSPKPWVSNFLEKDRQELWLKTVPELMKKSKSHVHSEL